MKTFSKGFWKGFGRFSSTRKMKIRKENEFYETSCFKIRRDVDRDWMVLSFCSNHKKRTFIER